MDNKENTTEINNSMLQEISDYLQLDSRRYDTAIKEDEQ